MEVRSLWLPWVDLHPHELQLDLIELSHVRRGERGSYEQLPVRSCHSEVQACDVLQLRGRKQHDDPSVSEIPSRPRLVRFHVLREWTHDPGNCLRESRNTRHAANRAGPMDRRCN